MIRWTRPLAASLLLFAAACGNDPTREGTFAVVASIAASAAGPILGTSEAPPPAASTPQEIAAILPQLPPGTVTRVEFEEAEQSFIAFQVRSTRGYRVLATVTNQTITIRNLMVTSTRGFAWDLMSSATNGAADVIRRRGSGTVQRIYRHLDASDDEIETVVSCAIAPEGSERITLVSGASFSTTRMREECSNAETRFTNLYWVTSGGGIPKSRQWISEEVGTFEIEVLRN